MGFMVRPDMSVLEREAYVGGYLDCRADLVSELEGRLGRGESLREWLVKEQVGLR